MIISNVHKSVIVINSIETLFRNVFETRRSTCFIGSKITRRRLVILHPIFQCCSFYYLEIFSCPQVIENFRQYLLLRTDILQKAVVECS